MSGSIGTNVFNNILHSNSTVPVFGSNTGGSGTTWGSNLVFGGNATNSTPGTGNIAANPQFTAPSTVPGTANFSLLGTSPAINAASASFGRTIDYNGNTGTRSGVSDIGAYQYGACAASGNAAQRSPQYLLNAFSGNGAGAISAQTMRDLVLSLACAPSGTWSH